MIKAELKSLHSPDADLVSYRPERERCFSIFVEAMIGPEGEDSSDSFGIEVCTPAWLESECLSWGGVFGRHLLIVPSYDYDEIFKLIRRRCEECAGEDWMETASCLSRIGRWEFEDYDSGRPPARR